MRYDYVLFDLDGTLTDPGLGITNCVMYALEHFGIKVSDRTELYKFIGPPLLDSFRDYYGFSPEDSRRAVAFYRERFADVGMFENEVYPGIPELLQKLKNAGLKLLVATSKPEVFAVPILERFGLAPYFDIIAGSDLGEARNRKAQVIEYALDLAHITERSRVIMVGDRHHDVDGAAECGIKCIGVLFGYGSREELSSAGATALAETVEDIAELILQ